MDANLFGSFSQSQSQKRHRTSSRKSNLPSSKPAPESSTKQREAVHVAEPKLRLVDSGKEDKMASALKDSKKASEATSVLKKPKPIKTLSELDMLLM
jgi:phage protein D